MAFDYYEERVGKRGLQKSGHEQVPRCLLHADRFAVVPISMPTRAESGDVLGRQ